MKEQIINESYYSIEILKHIADTVILTDMKGHFKFVCENVRTNFKYNPEEIWEMENIAELVGKDITQTAAHIKYEIKNIATQIFDKFYKKHDFLINISKVDIDGPSLLYTFRDITNVREAAFLNSSFIQLLEQTRQHLNSILEETNYIHIPKPPAEENIKITPRRKMIISLLTQGKRNRDIARAIGISESTVKKHLNVLFRQFGVSNRIELIRHLS